MALYRGFNTIDNTFSSTRLNDRELIKRDLLNHFSIRKGEKLMRPNFGTIIWDMIFEPLTEETRRAIIQDVTTIVNNDPRTSATNIVVDEFEQGIQIAVHLIYRQINQTEVLNLQFDRNTTTVSL